MTSSLVALMLVAGCAGPHPLRGGHALTTPAPAGGIAQSLAQSDNPAQPTRQTQETIKTRTYNIPAGIPLAPVSALSPIPSHSSYPSYSAAPNLLLTDREETRATTELGAAQKDTARELTAKLSSLRGIVWVGVILFIFGLASIFWTPLQTIIASVTTSIAITLGGVALMILPTLIVGNELLILGGVALAVGAWFLAHRHGHLRGLLSARNAVLGAVRQDTAVSPICGPSARTRQAPPTTPQPGTRSHAPTPRPPSHPCYPCNPWSNLFPPRACTSTRPPPPRAPAGATSL
jgi:hypothetical protein